MTTYALADGDTLTVSVDDGAWQTITFTAADVQDIAAATADELAQIVNGSGVLKAAVDAAGNLVLLTPSAGGHTTLEIDPAQSTAAAALGLAGGPTRTAGTGLLAARLVGLATEPFKLRNDAVMTLVVDSGEHKVAFDQGITPGKATAAEAADVINAAVPGVARATRHGRVMLTSPTAGLGSRIEVQPGGVDEGTTDAAAVLGFTGASALSEPYASEPARLACSGRRPGLQAANLSTSPVELLLATGSLVVPGGGTIPIAPTDAGSDQVQRLIAQGTLRLVAADQTS